MFDAQMNGLMYFSCNDIHEQINSQSLIQGCTFSNTINHPPKGIGLQGDTHDSTTRVQSSKQGLYIYAYIYNVILMFTTIVVQS